MSRLAIAALVFLLMPATLAYGQTMRVDNSPDAGREIRKKLLEPVFKMLKAKRVPFDPKHLLDDNWRSLIEPSIAASPDMTKTFRVTGTMDGVYMAGMVLMPEWVHLTGDTFILARELAPDDENSSIKITGAYQLVIFNIGDPQKFEVITKRRPRDHFLKIDIAAPCALVGISPLYLGSYRCRGMSYVAGWKVRS